MIDFARAPTQQYLCPECKYGFGFYDNGSNSACMECELIWDETCLDCDFEVETWTSSLNPVWTNKCNNCSVGNILRFDRNGCQAPVENCKVPVADQPAGLVQSEDDLGLWTCDECMEGYFEFEGVCLECDIEDCLVCSSTEICELCDNMNEAGEYLMLSPDKFGCQAKEPMCDIPLEN